MKTALVVIVAQAAMALALPAHAADRSGDPAGGEVIYNQTCVACHGAEGSGTVPGAPDFTRPEGVLTKNDAVLLEHILDGFQSPSSPMAMPAKGGNDSLTIKDIRDVLAYLHEKFHYGTYE